MNNIIYQISELENVDESVKNLNDSNINESNINESNINESYNIYANKLNYEINYSMKQLNFLCKFYKLKTEKKKEDTINKIVDFESRVENIKIINDFHYLMEKFIELKANDYFSKFIISPF
tara:strand:- start:196 stop:558 length:363 start_codon:yes stop_codon:yes gene_type:complete